MERDEPSTGVQKTEGRVNDQKSEGQPAAPVLSSMSDERLGR
jgi:hypothetical protein